MKKMNWINLFKTFLMIVLTGFCMVFIMAEPTETSIFYWTLILMKFAGLVCGYLAFILAGQLGEVISPKEKEEL